MTNNFRTFQTNSQTSLPFHRYSHSLASFYSSSPVLASESVLSFLHLAVIALLDVLVPVRRPADEHLVINNGECDKY